LRNKICLKEVGWPRPFLRRRQNTTTTAATAADEHRFLRILRLQYQPLAVGLFQQSKHLLTDRTGNSFLGHHGCHLAEHQAIVSFLGHSARLPGKLASLPADAGDGCEGAGARSNKAPKVVIARDRVLDRDGLGDRNNPRLGRVQALERGSIAIIEIGPHIPLQLRCQAVHLGLVDADHQRILPVASALLAPRLSDGSSFRHPVERFAHLLPRHGPAHAPMDGCCRLQNRAQAQFQPGLLRSEKLPENAQFDAGFGSRVGNGHAIQMPL
jgi:hypothetical protein